MPRKRNRWIAIILAFILSPCICMLYLGKIARSIGYFIVLIAAFILTFILDANFLWLNELGLYPFLNLVTVIGIIDSYRISKNYSENFTDPWYTRWYGVIGIFLSYTLLILSVPAFLVEPFRIPAGSMMPTLLIGDCILVNKFSYGIRIPLTNIRLIEIDKPERGDVIVFRYPKDTSVTFIKRVVGVPGDIIEYEKKLLYINNIQVERSLIGRYKGQGEGKSMTGTMHFREDLAGVKHSILIRYDQPSKNGRFVVPEGEYIVMGDNRDDSNDSLYWGTVPETNLLGKAFVIWWNVNLPSRSGTMIH